MSKLSVATIGRSGTTSRAAATAASTSARSLIVSISTRSMPPSRSPASCSAKIAWASAASIVPSGAISSPVGPEVAGHERAVLVGHLAGEPGAGLVELVDPVAEAVHVEPRAGAAEGVGGEDAGTGLGVRPVRVADDVGPLDVPQLTGAAVVEAAVLQQRAHAAVDQDRAGGGEVGEGAGLGLFFGHRRA